MLPSDQRRNVFPYDLCNGLPSAAGSFPHRANVVRRPALPPSFSAAKTLAARKTHSSARNRARKQWSFAFTAISFHHRPKQPRAVRRFAQEDGLQEAPTVSEMAFVAAAVRHTPSAPSE